MAQAGYYHQPSESSPDRAMCFTCNVCLVCWDKTDEPWGEHERHSPNCPFVKGEYTQNVPLAITYATDPATSTTGFTIVSNGNLTNIVCTAVQSGDIIIWKTNRQLKKVGNIKIRDDAHHILSTLNTENVQDCDIKLHSMCTYRSRELTATCSQQKPKTCNLKIICGVTVNREMFLVVYKLAKIKIDVVEKKQDHDMSNDVIENETLWSKEQKKSSLKNIVADDEYDDEYMKSMDPNYDWNEPFESNVLFPVGYKLGSNNVEYDMGAEEYNSPSSPVDIESEETLAPSTSTSSTTNIDSKRLSCSIIQSVPIVPLLLGSYIISDIIPSFDNKYMLVFLNKSLESDDSVETVSCGEGKMDIDDDEALPGFSDGVQIFVYEVNDDGTLVEEPICSRVLFEDHAPLDICMLPNYNGSGGNNIATDDADAEPCSETSDNGGSGGVFAIVCRDGSLQLISVTTLRTVCETNVKGKFVSVTYCKNLERLCACTSDGLLHFYSFFDIDQDSTDDQDDDKMNFMPSDNSLTGGEHEISETDGSNQNSANVPSTSTSPLMPGIDGIATATDGGATVASSSSGTGLLYAHKNELNLNDLKMLYSLTLFDEMLTQYSAEVPACWNELVQTQKPRRHPNHVRPGDDTHLTKTWRLHNDA